MTRTIRIQDPRLCSGMLVGLLLCNALLTERVMVQETAVPFDMCARSETWARPSPNVQSKVWNDARYQHAGPTAFEWTHSFIPNEPDSASTTYSTMNLSGVWTDVETNRCPRRDSERGRWTEIWSLNYHVTGISLTGLVYTLTVAPRERGYEIIQFRRPQTLGASRTTLRIITAEGNVLAEWMETSPSVFDPQ